MLLPLLFVYVRSCTYNSESIMLLLLLLYQVVYIYFLCAYHEAFYFSPSDNVQHELQRRSLLRKLQQSQNEEPQGEPKKEAYGRRLYNSNMYFVHTFPASLRSTVIHLLPLLHLPSKPVPH